MYSLKKRKITIEYLVHMLHRLTGLTLIILVFIHVFYLRYAMITSTSISYPPYFYHVMFGIACFHILNGFRILLTEVGINVEKHRLGIIIMMAVFILIFIIGSNILPL
jgi:succinate dehydrogenase/fumarate reductase cytochrome b subunit